MNLSLRERRLIGVALIVIAALALYFGALGPALSQSSYLAQEIEQTEKRIDRLREEQQKAKEAQRIIETLLQEFGPLLQRDDEAVQADYKMRQVDAAARAEQVRIITVQPLAPSLKGETWKRFPTQFNLEGDLIGVTNLLIRLRHVAPRLDVERVSMRADSEDPNRLMVQMIVSSYAFAPEKEKKTRGSVRTNGR